MLSHMPSLIWQRCCRHAHSKIHVSWWETPALAEAILPDLKNIDIHSASISLAVLCRPAITHQSSCCICQSHACESSDAASAKMAIIRSPARQRTLQQQLCLERLKIHHLNSCTRQAIVTAALSTYLAYSGSEGMCLDKILTFFAQRLRCGEGLR